MSIVQRFKALFGSELQRLETRFQALQAVYNNDIIKLDREVRSKVAAAHYIGIALEADFAKAKAAIEATSERLIQTPGQEPPLDDLFKVIADLGVAIQRAKADLAGL